MELSEHWHRCQNRPKKRVNTLLLYRERDDPVKERLANWRTRSGTLGSVEERYTGTLHGRTSKILATWQIDSYPGSYASLLIVERNTSVGNVPMCSASQTAFSTFSDQLLESANLRKIHFTREANLLKAPLKPIWASFMIQTRQELL